MVTKKVFLDELTSGDRFYFRQTRFIKTNMTTADKKGYICVTERCGKAYAFRRLTEVAVQVLEPEEPKTVAETSSCATPEGAQRFLIFFPISGN